jgi:D-glycero-D-manno-heptose 1,7-bisphosphate phosphatase
MKNKAIFLDRDGVINISKDRYYVYSMADWTLTPRLYEALKLLHSSGYLLIVITNQGGIAKGLYAMSDVEKLHQSMQSQAAAYGIPIEELYCCPHHEDYGRCLCRKPLPLLLQKAAARYDIDMAQSYFIGDSPRDMDAAAAAGVCGIMAAADSGIWYAAVTICGK